ncbi:TRAP transporter substrate-binding protein [Candidimonas sp. SYP-B2681]|uniref:TRAP transporter substrate-binding protein n=1 Tax=Candidimonas sp. SYP-B2681 TaxID=2497686 RepID=UPI000F875D81|nr:TRAP transporter substrate-binding protein [Candidimonas sp. SYP-B2681]RTZ48031.1 TRAP transporter substrate-binding protein [Candidimonas sp. SYP-B2681]
MKKMNTRRSALALIGCAAMLFASATAMAQDIKERNLKFAFSLAKDHPLGLGAQKFAELVAQKSSGKMKVSIYPSAVLGGDPQNLSAVRGGTLDFTSMATGLLSGLDKQFMVFDFPFLFNNAQEAYALSDGPVGQRLLSGLAAHGVVGLGIWDLGFRNMTNSKRPIAKVEDLQGLKVRVIASPIYIDMFNTLGANPVPMTFGEVYGALESKAIDGQDNPVGVIESAKFAEVQKFMSLTRHVYTGMPFLMSKKTWDAMSETERKIIADSADEAKVEERKLSQARELESIDKLRALMQVNDVTATERDRLRQKVAPVVEKFSREVGDQTIQQVNSELSRMRGGK